MSLATLICLPVLWGSPWLHLVGEPSVFTLVNEVFSWCWLWTHIHLPPGECSWSANCLRVFSSTGKEFFGHTTTVVFRGSSGSFGVAELNGAFLRFKNVSNSCFGHAYVFAISLWVCFVFQPNWWLASLIVTALWISSWQVDSNRFQMQINTLEMNSGPFICSL